MIILQRTVVKRMKHSKLSLLGIQVKMEQCAFPYFLVVCLSLSLSRTISLTVLPPFRNDWTYHKYFLSLSEVDASVKIYPM